MEYLPWSPATGWLCDVLCLGVEDDEDDYDLEIQSPEDVLASEGFDWWRSHHDKREMG